MHLYMYCACCSLVLPLALNPEDYTPTESQLCAFILALPPACCCNWLFSEHMTKAAPLRLYAVGLKLIRASFYYQSFIKENDYTCTSYLRPQPSFMCVYVEYLLFL